MSERDKLKIWNMQSYPRNTRQKWSLRDFLLLALFCLLAFWAGASIAIGQTYDEQGRHILHGDPQARPSPHHSGGGSVNAAREYYLSIRHLGPFRITGDWVSAGTQVVALVAGPDAVPGSCIDPDMGFHWHAAFNGTALTGALVAIPASQEDHDAFRSMFTPPLQRYYSNRLASGGITPTRFEQVSVATLGRMGYPVCED